MPQRFAINAKNSDERYLGLTYYIEEIINGISDRGDLERDLEGIKDSVSQS